MKKIKTLFQSKKLYSIIIALDIIALIIVFSLVLYKKTQNNQDEKKDNAVVENNTTAKEVEFIDSELEKAIKKSLGKKKLYENDLKNVRKITIKNNKKIKDFSELVKFEKLKELTITNCNMTDISILEQIPNLQIVNLSGNKIVEISGKMNLKTVKELNISNNKIKNLDFLTSFPNLTKLNISTNNLSEVYGISVCENLQYVNFLNNSIKDGEELIKLKKLHTIYIDEEFDRTQLDFLEGNFRNADVQTKKYLLGKQYDLN